VSYIVLSEENQPQQAGKERNNAGIEKSNRANLRFQLVAQQEKTNAESQNHTSDKANHPYREKRPDDRNRRRAAASGA
jgi:hypothetical protein